MTDGLTLASDAIRDIDLYGAVKRDPFQFYADHADRPPFYIMVEGQPQLVCTRAADSRAVLEDYARFSSVKQPYPGTKGFYYFNSMPSVTDSDPPVHTRRRRLVGPALSPRKLAAIEVSVGRHVDVLLDEIGSIDGAFDVVADYAMPLALRTLLGDVCDIPVDDWPIFTGLMAAQREVFNLLEGNPAKEAAYQAAWRQAWDYCAAAIAARRDMPADDLVSSLIAAQERGGDLTADELFATLVILYSAGIGGLVSTPSWTLWRLCRHPEQLAMLRNDPGLVTGAVTESLRMEPSSFASLRYATGDFDFAGLRVTTGMPVHTLSAGGNFDAAVYPEPLRFDITRPTDWRSLTSFGHGVHHCLGNGLARMVARIAIGGAVARFPGLRLDDPAFVPETTGVLKQRAPVAIPLRHR